MSPELIILEQKFERTSPKGLIVETTWSVKYAVRQNHCRTRLQGTVNLEGETVSKYHGPVFSRERN